MFIDDFVDILPIDIAVPDVIRINHQHRAFRTAIQATRCIYPNAARTGDIQCLAAFFRMVTDGLGVKPLATGRTVCAQIGTEKYVVTVVGHGDKILVRICQRLNHKGLIVVRNPRCSRAKTDSPLVTEGANPVSVTYE